MTCVECDAQIDNNWARGVAALAVPSSTLELIE